MRRATRSTLLGLRVTLKQLSGTEPGATASVRKLLGMRHAQQVGELLLVAGRAAGRARAGRRRGWRPGDGDEERRALGQAAADQRALTIGGGTTDIQLNIIAERILRPAARPEPPAA